MGAGGLVGYRHAWEFSSFFDPDLIELDYEVILACTHFMIFATISSRGRSRTTTGDQKEFTRRNFEISENFKILNFQIRCLGGWNWAKQLRLQPRIELRTTRLMRKSYACKGVRQRNPTVFFPSLSAVFKFIRSEYIQKGNYRTNISRQIKPTMNSTDFLSRPFGSVIVEYSFSWSSAAKRWPRIDNDKLEVWMIPSRTRGKKWQSDKATDHSTSSRSFFIWEGPGQLRFAPLHSKRRE